MGKKHKIKGLWVYLATIAIILSFFMGIFTPYISPAKATYVSGNIKNDTTWNLNGSPYIVTGNVWIDKGVNLTIEPGVEVKFDGYYYLYVDGNLTACGNETDEITFTSNEYSPVRSDWTGISVRGDGYAKIEFCQISYAYYGIYFSSGTSKSTISNSSITQNYYGVYIYYSSDFIINKTNITSNLFGVYYYYASNVIVNSSNILYNSNQGVNFRYSSDCELQNSNISINYMSGIEIYYSSNITISKDQLWDNTDREIIITGNQKEHFDHKITESWANGKAMYYYFGIGNLTLDNLEAELVMITHSYNVTVSNVNITDGEGLSLHYVSNSKVLNCNISHSYAGIQLYHSPADMGDNGSMGNIIANNTFSDNDYGIKMDYSEGCKIISNEIIRNDDGIYSYYSNSNWIYHNNFIYNSDQAGETGGYYYTNYWDNGKEGNYWTDYYGSDTGGDNIGDTAYSVSYYSSDNYPLIYPYNGSIPPDTTPPYFVYWEPEVADRTITFPRDSMIVRFRTNELGHYEIILDTDGIDGFDNSTDTFFRGETNAEYQNVNWNGRDSEGNYIQDGDYDIQVMIWDINGNPLDEPYDAGSVNITLDSDLDGVSDREDAFPYDPYEWEDFDGDGIGDNSDMDWDNDGYNNFEDEFPWDGSEWIDSDGDGVGDNEDPDDNDNGIDDLLEIPLVIFILLIPLATIYLTHLHIKGRKAKEE